MGALKKVLGWVFGGAIVGVLVASMSVHSYLPWYNQPGQGEQTLCDMRMVTQRILQTVFHAQLVGAAIGAGVGLIIGIFLLVPANKTRQRPPPAARPPRRVPAP